MPTYIKTGYWDKKAKAPDGWLDLNLFCSTHGGGGTNIYNSDGTLTGNRILSGANNDLTFSDLNIFKTTSGSSDIGLKLDFANDQYFFGNNNSLAGEIICDAQNGVMFTQQNFIQKGLIIDFTTDIYALGANFGNYTTLYVSEGNSEIKTRYQSNDIGLKIDFANNTYVIGDENILGKFIRVNNVSSELVNTEVYIGDAYSSGNETLLLLDDTNQIIKTYNSGNDIGLKLDFANSNYEFGQITGGNATTLKIDDAAAFPVQVSGTNVSQTTSGAASGKFLKIKVDGVDYVIELKNPS